MTILHDALSLFDAPARLNRTLNAGNAATSRPKFAKQKNSAGPLGAVGYMASKLSRLYAMAISIISGASTARVGARAFGQQELAGLGICK